MYNPDSWQLIRIEGQSPHYRVFGSWSGGYLDGDSWRLNSGIVRVEEEGDYYNFIGHTGSVYQCHKNAYGIRSLHNRGVLEQYANDLFTIVEEMPDIMSIDWSK